MLPAVYNLALYRGDSYAWAFRFWNDAAKTEPTDLTGITPRASMAASEHAARVGLTCVVTLPNIVEVSLSANAWTGAEEKSFHGRWDLEFTFPNGDVRTVIAGAVSLTLDVTKAS